MKNSVFLITVFVLLLSCKKSEVEPEEEVKTPNWEIVKNFPQDKSYTAAKLIMYDGKPFVTTYGHSMLTSPTNLSNQFQGHLFFEKADS